MESTFEIPENIDEMISYESTILLFGFSNIESRILDDVINRISIAEKNIRGKCKYTIISTVEISDVYAIPYSIVIINFQNISQEDRQTVIEYINESNEPISKELMDMGYKEDDFTHPIFFC